MNLRPIAVKWRTYRPAGSFEVTRGSPRTKIVCHAQTPPEVPIEPITWLSIRLRPPAMG